MVPAMNTIVLGKETTKYSNIHALNPWFSTKVGSLIHSMGRLLLFFVDIYKEWNLQKAIKEIWQIKPADICGLMTRRLFFWSSLHISQIVLRNILIGYSSVPSLRGGGGQGAFLPNDCLFPPFWFTQNTAFGTALNDKTIDNDGKRNNYV